MDTFHRVEFTGTWQRLFSRVKKHIIWGVLKSVTGMQVIIPGNSFNFSLLNYWPYQINVFSFCFVLVALQPPFSFTFSVINIFTVRLL